MLFEVAGRDRLAHDPERVGLLAGNVAAAERNDRKLLYREPGMQERRGDELPEAPAQNFRHAELGIVRREYKVVAVHDAERSTEAIAVDLGDHDARECAQVLGDLDGQVRAIPVEQRAIRDLAQEVEIEARRIDGAGALRDDDIEALVATDNFERLEKCLAKRSVPAVVLLRPIENDARDACIGEPLQKKLRPFLECPPDIRHAIAPDNFSPFCVSVGAVSSARARTA